MSEYTLAPGTYETLLSVYPTDPTVDNDHSENYRFGARLWINAASGNAFLSPDQSPGSAIWSRAISRTFMNQGTVDVSDGTTTETGLVYKVIVMDKVCDVHIYCPNTSLAIDTILTLSNASPALPATLPTDIKMYATGMVMFRYNSDDYPVNV